VKGGVVMKSILVFTVIIGLIFLAPNFCFGSDENSAKGSVGNSVDESSKNSDSNDSAEESASAVFLGVAAAIVLTGASIWGGITTTKSIKRNKMKKNNKKVATAVFNEATKGYGVKTNIEILAKYYCCTQENVVDTISKLSVNNRIDVGNSLIDEKIAGDSLIILENELQRKAENNGKFRENIKKMRKMFANNPDAMKNIGDIYNLSLSGVAGFYRTLFN
jgi:hypothetical protein